jgi:hypothetical protein
MLKSQLVLGESESDTVIRVIDMAITRPGIAIIHMDTTELIRTAITLGRHTTGPTDTAIIATTVIIRTIGTKLT